MDKEAEKLGLLILFWSIALIVASLGLTIYIYEHRLKQIEETSEPFIADLQAENYILTHEYEDVDEVKRYVKEVIYGIKTSSNF